MINQFNFNHLELNKRTRQQIKSNNFIPPQRFMQDQNPESEFIPVKHQTIEQYINENLQLKTLKIRKFCFENSTSTQVKSSHRLRNSQTVKQLFNSSQQKYDQGAIGWEPKLSPRKIFKEPKILLSVERRKIKTSDGFKKANAFISTPQSRMGFRGEKVKSHSFYASKMEERKPQKLVFENKKSFSQRKCNQIPNLHFNLQYVINQRKKTKDLLSVQEKTKKGSNQGYFAYFGSQNFTKLLQKNLFNSARKPISKAQERKNHFVSKKSSELTKR